MMIATRIASKIYEHPRLRAVPLGVIDDVVKTAIDSLGEHAILIEETPNVPERLTLNLLSDDLDECEVCSAFVLPDSPNVFRDDDGVVLCPFCRPKTTEDSDP